MDFLQFKGKKAAYFTLGCKLNFSETSSLEERLQKLGVETAAKGEKADLCIINTCSVTQVADRKGRHAVYKVRKDHPDAFVVVMGCYAQLRPQELASIPGVDLVLGTEEKKSLLEYLDPLVKRSEPLVRTSDHKEIVTFVPSCSRGSRTRYTLKVQDGCDCFCSYCTIPFARGRSRNGSISSLVEQARNVALEGGKEIVLTGVNIGDFGKTTHEDFLDLIRALDGVEGIERYRISSLEPDLLSEEMIRFVASSRRFMPHFHLPLQSGCDQVLGLMRRRYDAALFRSRVEMIMDLIPDCFIGVDVMVGARGETPERFEASRRFLEALPVSQLHVFSYSERPGTMALRMEGAVSQQEKKRRSEELLRLSEEKTEAFYRRFEGQIMPVLMERSSRRRLMRGFTPNYLRVELPLEPELDNRIVKVRLGETFLSPADGELCMKGEITDLES